MDFLSYVVDEALIVIPVLMILGKIIKQTPRVPDWLIPYMLLILGITFTTFLMGLSIEAFIQGILVTGGAVFGHQLIKQTRRANGQRHHKDHT
ncbi:phage holin family protein [Alteribacter aurantiacus]|uniref:phage holin family protein n=1 Tax=Alteribacter aurantiacus TaxID=254410 RepID=UPI000414DEC6|nr:phage holin family protein [Alteribacter aurantiacus]